MAGNLFHRKGQSNVRQGTFLLKKVKIRYGFRLNPFKMLK